VELGRLAISLPAASLSARQCVELAQRAEDEWGYDAIWLSETDGPDALALSGAIAVATSRIAVGTAIVPVYNRTPAVLAMAAGTLAQLSGDRFLLGLGSSSHTIVENWNGIAFELPLTRVRETVEVLRQALTGGKTDFEGRTLRSRGFRLASVPAKPIPIYLAALRERMLALAGEVGDGVILNLFPVTALSKILAAHRAGAAKAGRDASGDEIVCSFQVAVTDDLAKARELARRAFTAYVAEPVYNPYFSWCGFEAEAHAVADAFARRDRAASVEAMTDDLVDRITVLGRAERCREQVAEFVAAGVTTSVIAPISSDPREIAATYEAFAPAKLRS
jgi:probable F420-dependent oxidoreductase